jgi:hypothetical protein
MYATVAPPILPGLTSSSVTNGSGNGSRPGTADRQDAA